MPVLEAIRAQISVSTVVEVIAVGATGAIGLVFAWWAARKGARMAMAAFRKGKLSI